MGCAPQGGLALTRRCLKAPRRRCRARRKIDEALYEELESALLQADCGVAATAAADRRCARARDKRLEDGDALEES